MGLSICFIIPLVLLVGTSVVQASADQRLEEKKMYVFDATYLYDNKIDNEHFWEEMHFISSIQGIINSKEPRLYVYFVGDHKGVVDKQWLKYLREEDGWLKGRETVEIKSLDELVDTFRGDIRGAVVYDPAVAATSNVASTISGVEHLACVRYNPQRGSIYRRMVEDPNGPKLPVVRKLLTDDNKSMFTGKGTIPASSTPSTGSAKCDAYIWAKKNYLDTGKCNPTKIGYYIDAFWIVKGGDRTLATLTNHDYFIANKAFFCDLSPWDDETPNDDPDQPLGTDYRTLTAVLRSAYDRMQGKEMIHFGGFTPWAYKYTDHGGVGGKHGGVATEWQTSQIITCYNAYLDADAIGLSGMANASFFQHYPLKKKYEQKLPTVDDLKEKGYINAEGKVIDRKFITIYVGDYDSAAWLYQRMWNYWQDPARGTIPIGWAFNPNLADRFPVGMAMTRDKKSDLDFFIAGDSGAGYVNPGHLMEPRPFSKLPSALDAWVRHCRKYYEQWDIGITGFIIDGFARGIGDTGKEAYAKFSPKGIVAQKIEQKGVYNGMPFIRMDRDLDVSVQDSAKRVVQRCGEVDSNFLIFRTILWTPSAHKELFQLIKEDPEGANIEIVDPYTLMLLVKCSEEGK